jgi:ABC-2 type transport system permease protein
MTWRLRQWAATASIEARGHVNDSVLFLADYALRFLRVAVLLAVWRNVLSTHSVGDMSVAQVLTYTLIAGVFAEQLYARTYIELILWEGQLATVLLRPMPMLAALLSNVLGRWLVGWAFCSLPLLLCARLFGVDAAPASMAAALWFLLSLLCGMAVSIALDVLFATFSMRWNASPWILRSIRDGVTTLLSGALLPLAAMPWGLDRVAQWLPFAAMASAPLRIYIGDPHTTYLLLTQVAWAVILWAVASRVWNASRERVAGFGG